jgi:hypothetical protein
MEFTMDITNGVALRRPDRVVESDNVPDGIVKL